MAEAWIRARAHLSKTKVARKLAPLCRNDPQKASGVLIDFWSSVAEFAANGFIRDVDNQTLEDWANWRGQRGQFAKWVREKHMDATGRVPHWDEYQGALESRKVKDRERKRQQRERLKGPESPQDVHETSNGSHADGPQDVRAYDTVRDGTVQTENRGARKHRAPPPEWVLEVRTFWEAQVGPTTPAKIQRALGSLFPEPGWPVVKAALEVYVSPDEGPAAQNRDRRVDWFAADFHRWRAIAETPLVDAGGVLSERGRRLMRPA